MNSEKSVVVAGAGWICAGIVMLIVGYIEVVEGVSSGNPAAAYLMAVLIMLLGSIAIISRKRISNIIDSKHK